MMPELLYRIVRDPATRTVGVFSDERLDKGPDIFAVLSEWRDVDVLSPK